MSGQARNSPIITAMMTKTMPTIRAIAAYSIVVATSLVPNIGIVSRRERLAEVLRNGILPSLLGLSLQVPPGKISRRERGDREDVHVSTLLRLARALGATGNDLLRDCQ